jgi:PAS domain S-box-containing protein
MTTTVVDSTTKLKFGRILIAEDEGVLAEELRDHLEALGHEVVDVVDSGPEAVTAAMLKAPDLVLMDIRLRGAVDGIESAAQIRDRCGIPTIYLTAHSDEATVDRAKQTNPLGYLIKPVGVSELRITVEMALYRVELERRLRESESHFETTLNSIGDAVIASDADGRVMFLNPVAEALTKWTCKDAIGQPLERVFQLRDAKTGLTRDCPVRRALDEGRIVHLPDETLLVAKDGSVTPVGDSAAPIRDAFQVRGAVVVFRDLTEAISTAERIKRAEEEERQAQKMEVVGRLAGGLAHDINNLMAIVIGFGKLALDRLPTADPVRHMVLQMKMAGDSAAALTRQLLAFSRKQVVVPKPIDLNEVIADADPMLRRLIGPDIVLRTRLQPDLGFVLADRGQIEQVVMNLAANARDALPRGGEIVIATAAIRLDAAAGAPNQIPPGDYVVLSVSDDGDGMDALTRNKLFEPFFTTKEVGQGTGLGLATVYGIVQQTRGHIAVESELGQGSQFTIYLPSLGSRRESPTTNATTEARGGAETILLVEDHYGVREMTRAVLQTSGYRVLDAGDGLEALSLCEREQGPIDLLLTDAIMPITSGREVAERAMAMRPSIRVLFMSGFTEDEVLRKQFAAGRIAFIQKPFETDELIAKVRQVLDARTA